MFKKYRQNFSLLATPKIRTLSVRYHFIRLIGPF